MGFTPAETEVDFVERIRSRECFWRRWKATIVVLHGVVIALLATFACVLLFDTIAILRPAAGEKLELAILIGVGTAAIFVGLFHTLVMRVLEPLFCDG